YDIYTETLGLNHSWTIDSELRKNLLHLNVQNNKQSIAEFNESLHKLATVIEQNDFSTSAENNLKNALNIIQKHTSKNLSKEVNLIRDLISD
ncbi:MAG: hypothetical protein RI564_08675, partial [Gracilimonas sp.]|nr:hypothetical protein [Gracilimonas sp.]